nr:ankyrin repeat-containing protein NPR4-like [Ipomoea batatas]
MAAASSQEELHQQLPGGVGTSQEALPQQAPVDYSKYRPLYRAILAANWEDAEIFFSQNPGAIRSPINNYLETALHVGAKVGNASFMEKLVALLLSGDNEEVVEALSPRNGIGNTPLHIAARQGNIEVADILVRRNSNLLYLHNNQDWFPIHFAAGNGRKSKDAFLYFLSHTRDDEYGQTNPYAGPTGVSILTNLIVQHKFYGLVGKSIVNKMVLHHQAVKLLKCLCDQLKTLNDTQVTSLTKRAVFEATSLDIWQVILNIADAYPDSVYFSNSMRQTILQVAVINRSENVFNLVCGTIVLRNILSSFADVNSNRVLHLAGKMAPPHKLNLVSGAALQMQRELQWFKEVKNITPSSFLSYKNKDGKTPSMVFTGEHKELKEAGEKWMKDTANSCTIAAALIVTVVFAAAITVPGGNSGENGLPIFSNNNAFTIFAISNAASLFTSTTSLLVFLSILTSRFAEQDFLYALPKRLIIGLFTLFLSIIFMMIAFSATVYLVFGNNRRGVLIIVAGFACLPVTSFVLLQFPLLVALVSSTYGRGIFNSRGFPQLPY